MAAEIATGVPKPAAPSMKAPKQNAISSTWMRRSLPTPGDGVLDDFEIAGFDGDVVDEDGAQNDPADREQSIGGAHQGGGAGQLRRHSKDQDGDAKRRGQSGQARPSVLSHGQTRAAREERRRAGRPPAQKVRGCRRLA